MQFISQYGLFLLETFTLVAAILFTLAGIIALSSKEKSQSGFKITPMNEEYEKTKHQFQDALLDKKAIKAKRKEEKKIDKKNNQASKADKNNLYVIHFVGDINASSVSSLRQIITGIISVANNKDEVLVTIESGGGTVNSYGLAASQLQRLRDHGLKLTACIDKIAASGGYLMASVADTIIAAPFAIIGSIGVVAQLPNFHRWLKKHDIDVELITAGEHKRTLTVLGENTAKGRKKFAEDLDAIHHIFKQHIAEFRPQVSLEQVATGEHWLAKDAMALALVDSLATSDDVIVDSLSTKNVYTIDYKTKLPLTKRLFKPAANLINRALSNSKY